MAQEQENLTLGVADDKTTSYTNLTDGLWSERRPHTTLIVACYRVQDYLPDFCASLDTQTTDPRDYELVFVIDGCPDGSEEVVRRWMFQTEFAVRVVVKQNGGVSSARNAGLRWARGDWVSQPDPDDWLEPEYLAEIEKARHLFPAEKMFVARPILKSASRVTIAHPLEFKFLDLATRLIDLIRTPEYIQTLGGLAFVSSDVVRTNELRFDEELRLSEDAEFLTRYLLLTNARYVIVPRARYEYRTRTDGTSIVASESQIISRYIYLFGQAHRNLLRDTQDEPPQWLANVLLYFTFMLFRRNRQRNPSIYFASEDDLAEIRRLLVSNLKVLGCDRIQSFRVFDVPLEVRMAWKSAASGELKGSPVQHYESNALTNSERVCFFTSTSSIPEGLRISTSESRITNVKTRGVEFLGTEWIYQHLVTISPAIGFLAKLESNEPFEFELNGHAFRTSTILRKLGQQRPLAPQVENAPAPNRRSDRFFNRTRRFLSFCLSSSRRVPPCSPVYESAWVFSLPPGSLHDHLGELLKAMNDLGEINAWAVIDRDSKYINELAELDIPFVIESSSQHNALMKQATFLVANRLDHKTRHPFPRKHVPKSWSFVYLPDSNLWNLDSRILNRLHIDIVLALSFSQRELLTTPGSWFKIPKDSVLLAPSLRELTSRPLSSTPVPEARSLVISLDPVFRATSPDSQTTSSLNRVALSVWNRLLSSDEFRKLTYLSGVEVKFHTSAGCADPSVGLTLPGWIEIVNDPDTQRLNLTRATTFLTSYSKQALFASQFGAQPIYLQPDRTDVLGDDGSLVQVAFKESLGRLGSVVTSVKDCQDELESSLRRSPAGVHTADVSMAESESLGNGRPVQDLKRILLAHLANGGTTRYSAGSQNNG